VRQLQTVIHGIEVTAAANRFKFALTVLAALLLIVIYDLRCYRNLATEEAMDAAQLGRNLAEGKGFTTSFIRPLSIHLLSRRNLQKLGAAKPGELAGHSGLKENHPDLANPPVYPVVLAGLMRVLPFEYQVSTTARFWSSDGRFWRFQPDFFIALFNQMLLLAVIGLAFLWARKLFDAAVAWLSAMVLLGAEVLWRFSVSGLSTVFLLLIFMGVVWCLTLLGRELDEPDRRSRWAFVFAASLGALIGVGGLTRYAFAWLIVPAVIVLAMSADARRPALLLLTLATFTTVMTPWIVRNYALSGTPLGTTTYDVLEGTIDYPGDHLERSLNPNIAFKSSAVRTKLFVNLRESVQHDLLKAGGGWITAFFLAGLMLGFRSPGVRRVRHFLLFGLIVLIVAQAAGRTHLSDASPEINSENLLVILMPLVVVYGVSLFLTLLDRIDLGTRQLRLAAMGAFGVLACVPMMLTLLLPKTVPVVYPPYHPLMIQQSAGMLKEHELMMSDIPWAVAWYGRRQCVWLTLNAVPDPQDPQSTENFAAISDLQRTINALYLTQRTVDGRFLTDWRQAGDYSWGVFFMNTFLKGAPPKEFPLQEMPPGYLPDQLFVADRKRW
jgi:hypothetical protein